MVIHTEKDEDNNFLFLAPLLEFFFKNSILGLLGWNFLSWKFLFFLLSSSWILFLNSLSWIPFLELNWKKKIKTDNVLIQERKEEEQILSFFFPLPFKTFLLFLFRVRVSTEDTSVRETIPNKNKRKEYSGEEERELDLWTMLRKNPKEPQPYL